MHAVDYIARINAESHYISSCVRATGSIIMGPKQKYSFQGRTCWKITPYFSNLACWALLDNPTVENIHIVKFWIAWYLNHLNVSVSGAPNGSVFDYYADSPTGGEIEHVGNSPNYDSTDSYAATFLSLSRKYCQVTGDNSFINANAYNIELVGNALVSTINKAGALTGLTSAKPNYPAEYTMDNSEVNKGLVDMVWLQRNIFHSTSAESYYQTLLINNTNGIENYLWNASTSDYYVSRGSRTANWSTFYADAVCQLYPFTFGVIPANGARAASLYNKFNRYYPNWSKGYQYSDYPWAFVCYAAAVKRDRERVDNYLTWLASYGSGHPDKWYITEAAMTLMSAKLMKLIG